MIYVPAAVIQQTRDPAIAGSSELIRQCNNILGKPFFIRQTTWHLAACVERCWPRVRQTLRSPSIGLEPMAPKWTCR